MPPPAAGPSLLIIFPHLISYPEPARAVLCRQANPPAFQLEPHPTCRMIVPSRRLSSVVEQRFCKPSVFGSNPKVGSIQSIQDQSFAAISRHPRGNHLMRIVAVHFRYLRIQAATKRMLLLSGAGGKSDAATHRHHPAFYRPVGGWLKLSQSFALHFSAECPKLK